MGITVVNSQRGDIDKVVNVLQDVIKEAHNAKL
jgi:hypothetical protein